MGFKEWCVGQITLPSNFKQILNSTSPATEDAGGGLEVVCVGLSRTGTSSLKAALSIILPGKTFHAMDFLNGINDEESHVFWKSLEAKSATKDDISKFFSSRNYSAVCDVPCLIYWREIVRAHPHAKIILTVRDPSQWFKSINKALIPISTQIMRWSWMLRLICYVFYRKCFQIDLLRILFQQFQLKEFQQESTATQFYHEWNENILSEVPSTNLLVFDVRSGWGPLCEFLDCPEPTEPFPRLNDAAALVKHQRYVSFLVCLAFFGLFVTVCLLVWQLWPRV
eukprot:TRINITY_DN29791_c0_g1_i1.p1 TRINITY_DN29791_c0_g1~~TRINITY_DN29791_c0_g1_i1.p1  ORF type:complete len:282 (+),score=39.24 TRINITY_DN29791_c0_g1_i1:64-909(+)